MHAQDIDQKRLFDGAVREGTVAFRAAIAEYSQERFYAFCFYTDNDVTSVYPTANTIEGFQGICRSDSPADRNYYQWAPAEWDLDFGQFDDGEDRDFMIETNKEMRLDYEIRKPDDGDGDDGFGERKEQRLITLTNALLAIRESGVFANHAIRERLAFWVNIGDACGGEKELMFQPAIPHLETDDVHELRRLFEFK